MSTKILLRSMIILLLGFLLLAGCSDQPTLTPTPAAASATPMLPHTPQYTPIAVPDLTPSAQQLMASGDRFTERGVCDLALQEYALTQEQNRDLAPAFSARELTNALINDLKAALADPDQAICLDPRRAQAYADRAKVHADLGEVDEALCDYNRALALAPQHLFACFNRGLLLDAQGDLAGAADDFNMVIGLDPTFAPAYYFRGLAYFDRGDPDRAFADLEKALELGLDEEMTEVAEHVLAEMLPEARIPFMLYCKHNVGRCRLDGQAAPALRRSP